MQLCSILELVEEELLSLKAPTSPDELAVIIARFLYNRTDETNSLLQSAAQDPALAELLNRERTKSLSPLEVELARKQAQESLQDVRQSVREQATALLKLIRQEMKAIRSHMHTPLVKQMAEAEQLLKELRQKECTSAAQQATADGTSIWPIIHPTMSVDPLVRKWQLGQVPGTLDGVKLLLQLSYIPLVSREEVVALMQHKSLQEGVADPAHAPAEPKAEPNPEHAALAEPQNSTPKNLLNLISNIRSTVEESDAALMRARAAATTNNDSNAFSHSGRFLLSKLVRDDEEEHQEPQSVALPSPGTLQEYATPRLSRIAQLMASS